MVTDEKVTSNTFNDPFQDFMTNYNKKFVEGNSNLFNPSEEGNTHTISDTQVQTNLSKMEEQYEIIEDSANKEKKNTSTTYKYIILYKIIIYDKIAVNRL